MKKIATFIILMMTIATNMDAQDSLDISLSGDIVSNYIWRSGKVDDCAVQPSIGLSYKGFSLSAWGSYGLNDKPVKEIDLSVAYTFGGFNIGITDYWSSSDEDTKYFLYNSHQTSHVFEANIGYDFGFASLQWFTNFAGADARNTSDGKRSYLSYVEATVPFNLGGFDWEATLGAVPYSANAVLNYDELQEDPTAEPEYYYDANSKDFAITNISLKATKELKITKSFSLPVFAQIMANPSTQHAYFIFGITLRP